MRQCYHMERLHARHSLRISQFFFAKNFRPRYLVSLSFLHSRRDVKLQLFLAACLFTYMIQYMRYSFAFHYAINMILAPHVIVVRRS